VYDDAFNQLEALIAAQEIGLRLQNNQLCVLLGMPPADLAAKLGKAPIPVSPAAVLGSVAGLLAMCAPVLGQDLGQCLVHGLPV
jgi:hypothetical protein